MQNHIENERAAHLV